MAAARIAPRYSLALGALDRGAGQLPVGQVDAVLGRDVAEFAQGVVADLVAQAAGAGMDHHADAALLQAHDRGGLVVEDLVDHLDFEEVVARAERAALVARRARGPAG